MKPLHPLARGVNPKDTAEKTRGTCPRCSRNVGVTTKGNCRKHETGGGRIKKTVCAGSGEPARSLYSR